jgi:NADH-quinone oxidoreductase subunit C
MKPNALVPHRPENIKIEREKGLGQVITVESKDLINTAIYLSNIGYDWFQFATGVDDGENIEMVYHIEKSAGKDKNSKSVFIKTKVSKADCMVDSLVAIWPAANWHERETFDLFGVTFLGHPNIKRIFMPDDWEGYPLRKDYEHPYLKRRPDYF